MPPRIMRLMYKTCLEREAELAKLDQSINEVRVCVCVCSCV